MWKTFWRKNDASTGLLHALAQKEGNKPDVRWPTLSKFLNIVGIFWSCFLLGTACISKEDFLSNVAMCFGGVVVAIDTVLRSLKGKTLLRINKSWVPIFLMYESKCSDQNSKVVRFYSWKVAIPYFSGPNNRIEIDNFCCLVSCSKQLYKWKSFGAGSSSSNIAVLIINAQWQLFDTDCSNCKPVEKTWRSMTY